MIPDPDTLERIRAQAATLATSSAYHRKQTVADDLRRGSLDSFETALRDAYLRGADAGYAARCAEEREP